MAATAAMDRETTALYDHYRETILERDNKQATALAFDLMQRGRGTTEILSETIRAHAPYTHVPYHQRIDAGVVRFVNNDHCLLSSRATLHLQNLVPEELRRLPLTQTVWYVPTGLDIWNQLLGKMPGHYSRRTYDPARYPDGPRPPPPTGPSRSPPSGAAPSRKASASGSPSSSAARSTTNTPSSSASGRTASAAPNCSPR